MGAIVPHIPILIRPAVAGDLDFVDRLHLKQTRKVGWMPREQLASKIAAQNVIVAEDAGMPVGYCCAQDRYFKRDDVGIIYQLNVAESHQRKLVGAALIQATFERAAYGCRLFCLWCAQELEANHFWESIGFVPLAFRTGARGGKEGPRVHIFWQRRIRAGDCETPYWFPAKTDGGAMREDRLVLPIPPGTHWSDAMPILLPQDKPALEGPKAQHRPKRGRPDPTKGPIMMCRGQFAPPGRKLPEPAERPKPQKAARQKIKADPKMIAAARELRDRYLEQFNSGLILPQGKYAVSRQIEASAPRSPLLEHKAAGFATPPPLLEQKAA